MAAALLLLSNLGIGGSERKSVRVANALRRAGHDIHLAYLNAPHTLRGSLDPGVPVLYLDRTGKFSFSAVRGFKRYLVEQGISRVACLNLYPLIYAHPVAWQLGERAPVVSALINVTDSPSRRDERFMLVYAPLLRRTQHLVFGCRLQRDRWIERYRLPAEASRVIYNGVDQAHFNTAAIAETRDQLRQRYGLPPDAFVAVSVAQFTPWKQQVHLVRAVAALVSRGLPICALLVGDGDQRAPIERCIADLGLQDRVRVLGEIDDVRPPLKAADAFVLTSTAGETFSNAALEAMAMGLPVILSRIGGAAEMVEVGRNGFLYSPGDVRELAGHIAALAGNEDLTRRMGRAAMTHAQAHFGFTRMVDEYRTFLFPSASISMPGVELDRSHGNRKLTAPEVDW